MTQVQQLYAVSVYLSATLLTFMYKCMPFICRFVCKNNGVIFENQLLQIGLKSEYRQNLGELLSHCCVFFFFKIQLKCL